MRKCPYCGSDVNWIERNLHSTTTYFDCGSYLEKEIKYVEWNGVMVQTNKTLEESKEFFDIEQCINYQKKMNREEKFKKILENGKR